MGWQAHQMRAAAERDHELTHQQCWGWGVASTLCLRPAVPMLCSENVSTCVMCVWVLQVALCVGARGMCE
jgi:hypothetical protein